MKTSHELAREAAEQIDDLRDKICEDWPHEFAKIIADTYAEVMVEAERYKTLLAKTQIVMEVLAAQCLQKPYREMTAELQADIVDRCLENRFALLPLPEPPEATT